MFVPLKTTERFDRNIFTGNGKPVTLNPATPIDVRYYFALDVMVGTIQGYTELLTYPHFIRGQWCPIEVIQDGHSYCGWIDREYVNKNTPA